MPIDIQDAIADAHKEMQDTPAVDPIHDAIANAHSFLADESPAQQSPSPAKSLSRTARFSQGIGDLEVGLGQLAEHVAETPLNWARAGIRKGLEATGAYDAAALFAPVKTDEFDSIVQQRESQYQKARADAQQNGIDWWRLGGQAANPVNYLSPGSAATTAVGRIGQAAAQGAAVSAAQPSTTPGSFWWDKVKGAVTGAATGAAISGVVESAMPLIRLGINAARKALGGGQAAAATPAADAIVNSALASKGVDPNSIDVNVIAGLKQEAQSALEHDAEPSAESIANRARAESLPVPVRLLRGQATGDPIAYSTEQNLRGIAGVGEPITTRLQEQNSAFIQNLDALGAKNAPDPVSTGQQVSERVQKLWDGMQAQKEAAYNAVRNSRGQSAAMDQFTAAQQIRDALDTPQAMHAWDTLPSHIQRTIQDMEDGKLPLTVAQMQSLDKAWGADARAADGSAAYAINTARRILGNAPIQDDVGQEARIAYQQAKQLHANQMSMLDPKLPNGRPNPDFQPIVKSVVQDGKPPETLFQQHFMGAAPSVAQKNLSFLNQLDPSSGQQVGQTLMGEIKRLALSSASDERGTVSQSVLNSWARDPVKAARMEALMPDPAVQTFRNLASTVEVAKRFPVASTVNTSNTGSAVVNAGLSMLKDGAAGQVMKRLPMLKGIAEGLSAAKTQTEVQSALKPGVTLKSLLSATPSQAAGRRLLSRVMVPGAVAAEASDEE
jgi:hypothetical protein